jgi:hypothetical protein
MREVVAWPRMGELTANMGIDGRTTGRAAANPSDSCSPLFLLSAGMLKGTSAMVGRWEWRRGGGTLGQGLPRSIGTENVL